MTEYLNDQQFEAALERYKGAYVQLWLFSVSHKRLVIRFSLQEQPEDLYVIGVSCKYLKGAFSWRNGNVSLVRSQSVDESTMNNQSDQITKLIDDEAGFELVCDGGIAMVTSSDNRLWKSFEDPDLL